MIRSANITHREKAGVVLHIINMCGVAESVAIQTLVDFWKGLRVSQSRPAIKRSEREASHPPAFNAEVKGTVVPAHWDNVRSIRVICRPVEG
jgi:hypothetical protein